MPGPDRAARAQAHAVPHDMKMLATVFDMLHDNPLVIPARIAIFFFKPFTDAQHLLVSESLILVGIDTEVVQRPLFITRLLQTRYPLACCRRTMSLLPRLMVTSMCSSVWTVG
jgi:hypothetical protein